MSFMRVYKLELLLLTIRILWLLPWLAEIMEINSPSLAHNDTTDDRCQQQQRAE